LIVVVSKRKDGETFHEFLLTLCENHEFMPELCSQKDRQNSIAKFAHREVQMIIGALVAFRGVNFHPPSVSILPPSINNHSEIFWQDGSMTCRYRNNRESAKLEEMDRNWE
jgi:hypothetical protein